MQINWNMLNLWESIIFRIFLAVFENIQMNQNFEKN